jgi:3-phenylpropionate/cinnamic acid dioxygenase small subunit
MGISKLESSRTSANIRDECVEFLYHEAELLDNRKLEEWIDLLDDEVDYRVPVRVTKDKGGGRGFSETSFFIKEDKVALATRVSHLVHDQAWAEEIPSRTRRFITNVRVKQSEGDKLVVFSNLLLFRSQGETSNFELLSAERQDTFRRTGDGLKISARLVLLDHTILPMHNISILL